MTTRQAGHPRDAVTAAAVQQQLPCVGRDHLFYGETVGQQARAARLCHTKCPIRAACLALAFTVEHDGYRYGVWGGTTATERRRMYQRQTVPAPRPETVPAEPTTEPQPCEVCALPVAPDYIAKTGRARHGHHAPAKAVTA